MIVVLTVGNVLSRKILHQSWSFTEELVVAVFVLITLLAAALAARDGELVNLSLLPDHIFSANHPCLSFETSTNTRTSIRGFCNGKLP